MHLNKYQGHHNSNWRNLPRFSEKTIASTHKKALILPMRRDEGERIEIDSVLYTLPREVHPYLVDSHHACPDRQICTLNIALHVGDGDLLTIDVIVRQGTIYRDEQKMLSRGAACPRQNLIYIGTIISRIGEGGLAESDLVTGNAQFPRT